MENPTNTFSSSGVTMALKPFATGILMLLALTGSNANAYASSTGITFYGYVPVDNRCTIVVLQDGTLATNPTGNQLSSLLANGTSGIAEVTAKRQYEISVDAPTSFSSGPQGAGNNVTYTTYFSGTALDKRGLNFPMREGSDPVTTATLQSRTQITVDLVADRPDHFPAGNYTAYTTIRCE